MLEDLESLRLYKKYLNTIQKVVDGYFEEQKEYISCKKGCAKCCEIGAYPFSKIEFYYLMTGFYKLERDVQMKVVQNIRQLKQDYQSVVDKENYMYRCPFLDDDKACTLYEYRGLICRTFGLIHRNVYNRVTLPFCYKEGMNYSKVYNPETKKIDYDKVKQYGYQNVPMDYKISLARLTDPGLFNEESFDFGEIKSLVEWL